MRGHSHVDCLVGQWQRSQVKGGEGERGTGRLGALEHSAWGTEHTSTHTGKQDVPKERTDTKRE